MTVNSVHENLSFNKASNRFKKPWQLQGRPSVHSIIKITNLRIISIILHSDLTFNILMLKAIKKTALGETQKQGDTCKTSSCMSFMFVCECVPRLSHSWSLIKLLLSPLQGHLRQLGSTVHEHLHFHIDHLTKHLPHTQRRQPGY